MLIPHLLNVLYSTLFKLHSSFFPQLLIMNNDSNDLDFYHTAEEFQDIYQFPGVPPPVDPFTARVIISLRNTGASSLSKLVPDPSTLMHLQVPYVGLPTSKPTGGLYPRKRLTPTQLNQLQKKVLVRHFYHSDIPHAADWSCDMESRSG